MSFGDRPLTQDQILQVFADFGLADERTRQQFQQLQTLSEQPKGFCNFIRSDDITQTQEKETKDAKLA